jgi:pimeloyl-ACP methyl ester carboxylesterase
MFRKTGLLFFIFLISLFPVSFSHVFVSSQQNDYRKITGYEEWTQDTLVKGTLDIGPKGTLVIRNGVAVTFDGGTINVSGDMVVSGTVKNPVIFRKGDSANYTINVSEKGKLVMRNVDVSGSGFGANTVQNNIFLNKALASYATGGINVDGGWLDIESCSFHDNNTPIDIENATPGRVKVNRSKFINNENFDVYYFGSSGSSFDFQYNWWGSPEGPSKYCYSPDDCYYEKFNDEVDFSNWLTSETFHDPVIIIPGILGSQKENDKWQMDPVLHTYDNLYQEFVNNGYVPEKDLFEFPYEWRDSNVENAKLLKAKIKKIKEKNNWPKVDIVAHSMGGLLAREYIESDYYKDDVDQLITLGTPHNGAPEAYLKWDGDGWFFLSPFDMIAKYIFQQESKENGYSDIFDYIHQRPILSLKELLPVYNYLQEVENDYQFRNYPDNYPRNEFLEGINSDIKKEKLNNVEFDKIIGKLENEVSTISGFKVIMADMGKYWIHGYPHGFEIPIGDQGITYRDGDGTVPLESAESVNIPADEIVRLKSDHRSLPTDAQSDVLELLTKTRPATENRDSIVKDILITSVYSPVDIQIIAPNGKWAGKNINGLDKKKQIPGAYYSGYDTDTEFLTIPNPKKGEYKIITQGTDNGPYRIEVAKISEDESGLGVGTTAEITGMATTGSQEELAVEVRGNKVITSQDKIPPTVKINSPESGTYQNNETLEIGYDVSDDVSLPDNIKTEIFFDGNPVSDNKIDLSLEHLGAHNIHVRAIDESGNVGEDEIEFTNDANIDSIISNVDHYFDLNLITKKSTKIIIKAKLEIIAGKMKLLGVLENKWMPWWAKEKVVENMKDQINHEIEALKDQIKNQKNLNENIDPKVRELLVENLEKIEV